MCCRLNYYQPTLYQYSLLFGLAKYYRWCQRELAVIQVLTMVANQLFSLNESCKPIWRFLSLLYGANVCPLLKQKQRYTTSIELMDEKSWKWRLRIFSTGLIPFCEYAVDDDDNVDININSIDVTAALQIRWSFPERFQTNRWGWWRGRYAGSVELGLLVPRSSFKKQSQCAFASSTWIWSSDNVVVTNKTDKLWGESVCYGHSAACNWAFTLLYIQNFQIEHWYEIWTLPAVAALMFGLELWSTWHVVHNSKQTNDCFVEDSTTRRFCEPDERFQESSWGNVISIGIL